MGILNILALIIVWVFLLIFGVCYGILLLARKAVDAIAAAFDNALSGPFF